MAYTQTESAVFASVFAQCRARNQTVAAKIQAYNSSIPPSFAGNTDAPPASMAEPWSNEPYLTMGGGADAWAVSQALSEAYSVVTQAAAHVYDTPYSVALESNQPGSTTFLQGEFTDPTP